MDSDEFQLLYCHCWISMTLQLCRPLVIYFDEIDLETDRMCALAQTQLLSSGNPYGLRRQFVEGHVPS